MEIIHIVNIRVDPGTSKTVFHFPYIQKKSILFRKDCIETSSHIFSTSILLNPSYNSTSLYVFANPRNHKISNGRLDPYLL